MARKIGILKEFLPALLPKYKIMLLEAFSPHDLLTAYIKNTLSGYPRLEDQNLDDLTLELLYPTDEAAEHCIKEFLALRLSLIHISKNPGPRYGNRQLLFCAAGAVSREQAVWRRVGFHHQMCIRDRSRWGTQTATE